MNWKERYLCSARRSRPDVVPIAPETFYYIPVRVSGLTCQEVAPVGLTLPFHKRKTWEAQLECARYFDICGWVMPAVGIVRDDIRTETHWERREDGSIEATLTHFTRSGELYETYWFPPDDASWHPGRCVKDPKRDWPLFLELSFSNSPVLDLTEVNEAVDRTGGQGIVSVYVGCPFTDWLAEARHGGYERIIYELLDDPAAFKPMQERYLEHIRQKTRLLCEIASFDELFIGNEYSELPLLSPRLWREWDAPVLRVFTETAQAYGKVTHWHQHGSTRAILDDFADSGLSVLCPLEAPPGGDVDLAEVKRRYGDRMCLKGNVETNLLLNGAPEQVKARVRECLQAAGDGAGFILGTGDQVAYATPFENLRAFVEAGWEFGKV